MGDWAEGGVLGSLRKRVRRELRKHQRSNPALRAARYPLHLLLLRKFFGERTIIGFLLPYTVLVLAVLGAEMVLAQCSTFPAALWSRGEDINSLLRSVTSYYLGAQVVMIGLLFPIAVGLVTLIVQREEASSTISDIQVYYNETFAYGIGASGISLSIVLAVQLLWPAQIVLYQLGLGASLQFSKVFLTAVHAMWLVINFVALWHFLGTSLSFIRPADRALLRRRFAANHAIPQDLFDRYSDMLFFRAGSTLLSASEAEDDQHPYIRFGSSFGEWGAVEVEKPHAAGKVLVNVWMTPLGWILRRWRSRCQEQSQQPRRSGRSSRPTLIFLPNLGQKLDENGVICRRNEGVPLI